MKYWLLSLLAASALAAPKSESSLLYWKLERTKESRTAVGTGPLLGIRALLRWGMGEVKLVDWKISPVNTDIGILIYSSGATGTGPALRLAQRAAIVRISKKEIIGDAVWHWSLSENGKAKALPEDEQPKWNWKMDGVEIDYPSYGDKVEFKF